MPIKCRLCDKTATHLFHCDDHYHCADCGAYEGLCTYREGVLCEQCHEKRVAKRMSEFAGCTEYTDEVTCPHCGYEHSDCFEMNEGERECPDCERSFDMVREITVTYSTTKITPLDGK